MGGRKSSLWPTEGTQYKSNGYILPGPCLQGRHPPPYLPRADHGQTLPLSVFSFQSNLNKTEHLAIVWGGWPLPSPTPSVSPSPRTAEQLEQMYLRCTSSSQGKSYQEGAVENAGQPHT